MPEPKPEPVCPDCNHVMDAAFGLHFLPAFDAEKGMNLAEGYPVQVYSCVKCGRLQFYSAVVLDRSLRPHMA